MTREIDKLARCVLCMYARPLRNYERQGERFDVVNIHTGKWVRCEKCKRAYMKVVDLSPLPKEMVEEYKKRDKEMTVKLNRSYGGMRGYQTRMAKGKWESLGYGTKLKMGFALMNPYD